MLPEEPQDFVCPACSYDLTGCCECVCPECGQPFSSADIEGFESRREAPALLKRLSLVFAPIGVGLSVVVGWRAADHSGAVAVGLKNGGLGFALIAVALGLGVLTVRSSPRAERTAWMATWVASLCLALAPWTAPAACAGLLPELGFLGWIVGVLFGLPSWFVMHRWFKRRYRLTARGPSVFLPLLAVLLFLASFFIGICFVFDSVELIPSQQ